jgi:hypothetical protein
MRFRLGYYDQNERFASLLPRDGTVERFVVGGDGQQWALFRLDEPIEYDGRRHDYLLLRSRWRGYPLGGAEQTSVFIFLVDQPDRIREGFHAERSDLVAWGMVPPMP